MPNALTKLKLCSNITLLRNTVIKGGIYVGESNESRERLISCAKAEFLRVGYQKASLRHICTEAGLTTGAVYFMFGDKNGLFGAVVEKPLSELFALLGQHIAEEKEEDMSAYTHIKGDHDAFAQEIVELLYENYDEMMILLDKSQGSEYENLPDRIIAMLDECYGVVAQRFAKSRGRRVNEYMLHYMSHIQVESIIHLLTHERDKQKAVENIKPVFDMLVSSFVEYVLE